MLNLAQSLAAIDKQRKCYRILLNKSRYKKDLQKADWQRAAALFKVSGTKNSHAKPDHEFAQDCQGTLQAFENARQNVGKSALSVTDIMVWHFQMLGKTAPYAVGQFRHDRAHWLLSTMIFANWERIPYLMDRLVSCVNKQHIPAIYWKERPDKQFQDASTHPMITAIEANYNLVAIHPFQDGNKRTARLLSAWVLGRRDYVPLCIHDSATYIDCIELYANTQHPHSLYGFMLDEMQQSYDDAINEARRMEKIIVPGGGNGSGGARAQRAGR